MRRLLRKAVARVAAVDASSSPACWRWRCCWRLRTAPGRRALLRVALPTGQREDGGAPGGARHRRRLVASAGAPRRAARRRRGRGDRVRAAHRGARRSRARCGTGACTCDDLRVDGARLTLRHLPNNQLNLAALGKPPSAREQVKASDHEDEPKKPFLMEVDHFHLQVDGAYHPPRGHEAHTVEWPHGTFDIDGAAQITSAQMHFRVDRLVSDARDPLHAHVELKGGPARHAEGAAARQGRDRVRQRRRDGDERRRRDRAARARCCIRAGAGRCTPRAAGRCRTCARGPSSTGRAG